MSNRLEEVSGMAVEMVVTHAFSNALSMAALRAKP